MIQVVFNCQLLYEIACFSISFSRFLISRSSRKNPESIALQVSPKTPRSTMT